MTSGPICSGPPPPRPAPASASTPTFYRSEETGREEQHQQQQRTPGGAAAPESAVPVDTQKHRKQPEGSREAELFSPRGPNLSSAYLASLLMHLVGEIRWFYGTGSKDTQFVPFCFAFQRNLGRFLSNAQCDAARDQLKHTSVRLVML